MKPMIILTGPTAVGKTGLSISLARAVNGSVISADSMQVYRHMDIGSAKIRREEMADIPHYLIDCLEPREDFNIVRFVEMAKEALEEIFAQGRIPIVTGGTGFYIQGLLYDIDFTENEEDSAFRREMSEYAQREGAAALHEKLKAIDPVSYETIHCNNVKRVIRALEYYRLNGEPISAHNTKQRLKSSPYNFAYFVLNDQRDRLYRRIDERVDEMVKNGLVDEVSGLKAMGCRRGMVSMQGLGYKEILDYLDKKTDLDSAVRAIKQETRHFAKRQLTWFRRERDCIWIDKDAFSYDEQAILQFMLQILKEKGIL